MGKKETRAQYRLAVIERATGLVLATGDPVGLKFAKKRFRNLHRKKSPVRFVVLLPGDPLNPTDG